MTTWSTKPLGKQKQLPNHLKSTRVPLEYQKNTIYLWFAAAAFILCYPNPTPSTPWPPQKPRLKTNCSRSQRLRSFGKPSNWELWLGRAPRGDGEVFGERFEKGLVESVVTLGGFSRFCCGFTTCLMEIDREFAQVSLGLYLKESPQQGSSMLIWLTVEAVNWRQSVRLHLRWGNTIGCTGQNIGENLQTVKPVQMAFLSRLSQAAKFLRGAPAGQKTEWHWVNGCERSWGLLFRILHETNSHKWLFFSNTTVSYNWSDSKQIKNSTKTPCRDEFLLRLRYRKHVQAQTKQMLILHFANVLLISIRNVRPMLWWWRRARARKYLFQSLGRTTWNNASVGLFKKGIQAESKPGLVAEYWSLSEMIWF